MLWPSYFAILRSPLELREDYGGGIIRQLLAIDIPPGEKVVQSVQEPSAHVTGLLERRSREACFAFAHKLHQRQLPLTPRVVLQQGQVAEGDFLPLANIAGRNS